MSDELEQLGGDTNYKFEEPEPELLETFTNEHESSEDYLVTFGMPKVEFTSLCPRTSQPDWAKIGIAYVPDVKMVESKSLKLYLFSYRNHGAFHEQCINEIADDLYELMEPKYLRVFGDFNARGGIAIKPIVERKHPERFKEKHYTLVDQWDKKKN